MPEPAPTLVLICGPIAAGKSAFARALADDLRPAGERVALVGLDEIAEMALPTLPSWEVAAEIFASVVGQWLRVDLDVVVAEGPGDPGELALVRANVPAASRVLTVVLTSSFDIALSRAQADPTRGISRDPDFLAGMYERWQRDRPLLPADLVIETGERSIADSVAAARALLAG